MPSVFGKLNLKDAAEIIVLDSPESFESALAELDEVAELIALDRPDAADAADELGTANAARKLVVRRSLIGVDSVTFFLAFVTRQREVDAHAKTLARLAKGDANVWFAYPKGTSKKYRCDFNRDTGWAALGKIGFEGVRQIAIDEDWTALRFRRVEFIKTMTRDAARAKTRVGKQRASEQ